MTEPEQEPTNPIPEPETPVRIRRRLPTVWLIPLVATLIGLWLAFNAFVDKGPTFVIAFRNGDGLEAGRTKLKCKDVEVGKVKSLKLSHDRTMVEVTAELTRDAAELLSADSR